MLTAQLPNMHTELVPARIKHFFPTMGALERSPPKQLPIPTGRAIKSDAMPDPMAILYSFPTVRACRLVIGSKQEWHDHGKNKNKTDKSNGHGDRCWLHHSFKRRTRHDHADHDKQKHDITDDCQNAKLPELPPKCELIYQHMETAFLTKTPPWAFESRGTR